MERYNNESSYKEWFDSNFTVSIENVVGYPETSLSDFPNSNTPRLYYVERYNNEPNYREWFDNSFPNDSFEDIISNTIEKGKDLIEDLTSKSDTDPSSESEIEETQGPEEPTEDGKSARQRLKDKGYLK